MILGKGQIIGGYVLERRLGVGGMAEVFLGVGQHGRKVALKVLLPELRDDPDIVRSFIDEANIAGGLSHPNIVDVYEFGESAGAHYMAMEYIDGWDLRQLLRRAKQKAHRCSPAAAAYVVHDVAAALHYVHTHDRQIVHRDVTPHNIYVTRDGYVKLGDFGVAKADARVGRTLTGELKGKLAYLAPEQLRGEAVTARTDVYALGLLLFELLTNERFNPGDSDSSLLSHAINPQIRRPSSINPEAAPLDKVVIDALALHPTLRIRDAGLLADELMKVLQEQPYFYAADMAELARLLDGDELAKTKPFHRISGLASVTTGTMAPKRRAANPPMTIPEADLPSMAESQSAGEQRPREVPTEEATTEHHALSTSHATIQQPKHLLRRPKRLQRMVPAVLVLVTLAAGFYWLGRLSGKDSQAPVALRVASDAEAPLADDGAMRVASASTASNRPTDARPAIHADGGDAAPGPVAAPHGADTVRKSKTTPPRRKTVRIRRSVARQPKAQTVEPHRPATRRPAFPVAKRRPLRKELSAAEHRAASKGLFPGDQKAFDQLRKAARKAVSGSDPIAARVAVARLTQHIDGFTASAAFVRRKLARLDRQIVAGSLNSADRERMQRISQEILRLVLADRRIEASQRISQLLR